MRNWILAQTVNTMADLKNAIGRGLGVVILFFYVYAVILIGTALLQDRGDGSWKYGLARGIGLFAVTGFCNILLSIFFPGAGTIAVNFN